MENENKNTTTPLITSEDVPTGRPDLKVVPEPVQMIEMPEHLKPQVSEKEAHDLGSTALDSSDGGRFNNGSVPVESPTPEMIRKNFDSLGGDTYAIPKSPDSQE